MNNMKYNLIEIGNGVPIKAWTKGVKLANGAKALKSSDVEIERCYS